MADQNDKGPESLDFDPRHIETFLNKISKDRESAIKKIQDHTEEEIRKIRKEAFRNARAFAHRTNTATREEEARKRSRLLYKASAELKREHWSIIAELRQTVLDKVSAKFYDAWKEPEQQWAWCTGWLDTATLLAHNEELDIVLGAGGSKDVADRIESKLKHYGGGFLIEVDKNAPAGIMISWPDHHLDGTLMSHCQEVSEDVANRLAQIMSAPEKQEDEK